MKFYRIYFTLFLLLTCVIALIYLSSLVGTIDRTEKIIFSPFLTLSCAGTLLIIFGCLVRSFKVVACFFQTVFYAFLVILLACDLPEWAVFLLSSYAAGTYLMVLGTYVRYMSFEDIVKRMNVVSNFEIQDSVLLKPVIKTECRKKWPMNHGCHKESNEFGFLCWVDITDPSLLPKKDTEIYSVYVDVQFADEETQLMYTEHELHFIRELPRNWPRDNITVTRLTTFPDRKEGFFVVKNFPAWCKVLWILSLFLLAGWTRYHFVSYDQEVQQKVYHTKNYIKQRGTGLSLNKFPDSKKHYL